MPKRRFSLVFVCFAFSLSGCTAGHIPKFCEAYTDGGTRNMDGRCGALIQKAEAKNLEKNTEACQGYGFQKGTTEFANCLMTLDQNNKKNQVIQDSSSAGASQSVRVQPFNCVKAGSILQCN